MIDDGASPLVRAVPSVAEGSSKFGDKPAPVVRVDKGEARTRGPAHKAHIDRSRQGPQPSLTSVDRLVAAPSVYEQETFSPVMESITYRGVSKKAAKPL